MATVIDLINNHVFDLIVKVEHNVDNTLVVLSFTSRARELHMMAPFCLQKRASSLPFATGLNIWYKICKLRADWLT